MGKRKGAPPSKRPGRPIIPIDWNKVAAFCMAGCSGATIAHELGITADTLYNRCQQEQQQDFSAFRSRHVMRGDDVLRLKQFEVARNGDVAMLKWLGKNRLGQRDNVEHMGLPPGSGAPTISVVVMPPSNNAGG